ncbi:putative dna repair protein rad50 [Phaeomoniella chlamydospora]|uniref:DNA repair protein RAD50 n=1 Tax=Phaeomoniella chlamydospora TaxID=158046 RepID=A0A0G2F0W7_PHACM|nr:putative dna repair protein rad50 [Phaeomoniella chlamydospora]
MSSIDKISITGIRSFSNRQSETVRFFSPLTLIVGHNGSGKTTIVECLKYATTGELPPNSKGGAFIHDPGLAGEKEVLGQVKIQFQGTSQARLVATRNMQLTVKKATRSFKTLEGTLTRKKDGETMVISSRVAELDQVIPQYLGVSTAILDNVIFCHQDESLWPMSEPSVLKKKFDEIFEAQKYTKAIENIKQLRKKQNEELGKHKINEQHLKSDKDKADRVRKKTEQLADEIEEIRVEVQELTNEMARTRESSDKAWKESEAYAQVLGQLEGKRIEAEGKRRTIQDLQVHLKEVDESEEWLESTLEQYGSRLQQYHEQNESKKEAYMELKRRVEVNRQQLGVKQKKYGELENDKAQYQRNLTKRQALVKQVAERHSIRGFDEDIDEDMFSDFMRRLRKLAKDQANLFNKVKQDGIAELREAQSLRNQLDRRDEALRHDKQNARQQVAANERDLSSCQAKADQILVDEGSKAVIDSQVEDVTGKLQRLRDDVERAHRDEQISSLELELRSQEAESSKLSEELIQGTKKAGETAQLDHLKRELKDRNRSLETMLGAHRQRIENLIGKGWGPANIEKVYQEAYTQRGEALQEAERERDATSRELEQVEFRLKTLRDNLKNKIQDATESEKVVRAATARSPEDFTRTLEEAEKELEELKNEAGVYAGYRSYMMKAIAHAEKTKTCRTCTREFGSAEDIPAFTHRLKLAIQKALDQIDPDGMAKAEEEVEAMRRASTHYATWQHLSTTEIPELRKGEQQLSSNREILLSKFEEHDRVVAEKAEQKRDVESISKTVSTITKYNAEIHAFERQIQDLTSKQSQQGITRTLEDIQEDMTRVSDRMRVTKQSLVRLSKEKEATRTEIAELDLKLRDLRNESSSSDFQLERKAGFLARVEEIKAHNKKLRETMSKADEDLQALEPEIAQAKARYEDVAERTQARESEVQRDASTLSDHVHQLDLSTEQIQSYVERDGPQQLESTQQEIQNIEADISQVEGEQNKITAEINHIASQLHDSESTRRQYSDNLRYRQELRALQSVEAEIRHLESQNADVDRSRFQRESERLTKRYNELSARQAGKMGEMKEKDVQLQGLLAEWDTSYKDVARQYREVHIKVETTKAAVEDLGRYSSALDKAVMTYHSLKMAEINRIIEELWRETYQGTDVDTIFIRSDNENSTGTSRSSTSTTSNRSYNYRVCMVKSDTEMDMRGRCSAGQKVLASIIIRLALAECFGTNCGLIALDEPTTNLDQDNIRALANSLHDIIKTRQKQANFQIIIITHDEQFLREMGCAEFADYYYRCLRDENQKSIIEKQSIAAIRA